VFKKQPKIRQYAYFTTLGAAFLHGASLLMFDISLDSPAEAVQPAQRK
jgi:hypothetical protein